MTPARRVAFDVLQRVEGGAKAADLLDLKAAALKSRDAGLATEIVMGVLRRRAQLDYLIERGSGRSMAKLDPPVRTALRMGAYQVAFLDRVPSHAAVSESVELVKRASKGSAAGLVNAVLRHLAAPGNWPDRATRLSLPEWMLARWERQFGAALTEQIGEMFLRRAVTYARGPGKPPEGAAETEIPGCYRLEGPVPEGWRRQDISSQAVVPLLELAAGQRFLDLCAAPGNKTAQALESGAWGLACDASAPRLQTLAAACPRVQLDATEPLPFGRVFDRILVDAPCSGTGTLRRNPEIRWRLQPEDIARHQQRQQRILANALACLKPGGRLVYSTCSLEDEENAQVTAGCGAQVLRVWERIPGREAGDGFRAAVLTV